MLPPLMFDKHATSRQGYMDLVKDLLQSRHAQDNMLVISELLLHLEMRVHEVEKEVERLRDAKIIVGN